MAKASEKNKAGSNEGTIKRSLIIIAVFSFLLYFNTIPNKYGMDDNLVTVVAKGEDRPVTSKGIKAIPEIFATPYYKDAAGNQFEYRPVALATFAVEHWLFGANPHISHLINTLIYTLLSMVLFLLLVRLFKTYNYLLPFFITLLFIAHPLHTEAVASIKNRDEILCLLGGVLSFYFSLAYFEKGRIGSYALFLFFFVFAALSKKSILPFALLIPISHVLFGAVNFKRLLLVSLPLGILLSLFWPLDSIVQRVFVGLIPVAIPPVIPFFLNKFNALPHIVKTGFATIKRIPQLLSNAEAHIPVLNKTWLIWLLLPLNFLCALIFCYFDLKSFIVAYFLFLGLLFLFIPNEKRTLFFYSLIIFITVIACFYLISVILQLLFILGLTIYFTGQKKVKDIIPLGIIFIIVVLFKVLNGDGDFVSLLVLPLLFYLFFETNKRIITVGVFAVGVVFTLFFTVKMSISFCIYSVVLLITGFLYRKPGFIKSHSSYFFALAFVPVVLIYFVANRSELPRSLFMHNSTEQITNSAQKLTTTAEQIKIIPASGRELNFVEMPVKDSDPVSIKLGTSFIVLGKYLQLLVVPYHLGFYYGYAEIEPVPLTSPGALFSLFVYLALVVSAFYFFKKHPVYSYGILFYILCISAFSNFAAPVAGIMADRLAFVASAGFCIAMAYVLLMITGVDIRSPKASFNFSNKKLYILTAVLVLFSIKTISRNFLWKNPLTLMQHDVAHLERSVHANNLLAVNMVKESFNAKSPAARDKLLNDAVTYFKKAVEIYPRADFAWYDLGRAYVLLNNKEDALPAFLKAVEIDSTYYDALIKAGAILIEQKKYDQAIVCFDKLIRNDTLNLAAYSSLSQAYFMKGDFQRSIEINLIAMRLFPRAYDPVVNIGKTYFTMGDKTNALIYFEKAYILDPNDKNLILAMANIYKEKGDMQKADFYFSKLNR